MKILINSEIDILQWQDFLNYSINASPFQSPEFYRVINSITGYSADVFAMVENNTISSIILITIQKERGIKALFSKRGIIYGGPLFSDKSNNISQLLEFIKHYYRLKLIYLETRNFFDYQFYKQYFVAQNWKFIQYLNFQLKIEGETFDSILKKFQYNRRREIRQSQEEGATYSECNNLDELTTLYNILEKLYNTRVKLPLPDIIFFRKLYESGICKVFVVKHNEKIIGGSICLYRKNQAIYSLYYCGIRNYHKKIFPTHLAILAAIDFATKNSLKYMDFMGAGKPDEKYGVRSYKKEFGGQMNEFGRFILILNPLLYNIGKLGLKILSKIQ